MVASLGDRMAAPTLPWLDSRHRRRTSASRRITILLISSGVSLALFGLRLG